MHRRLAMLAVVAAMIVTPAKPAPCNIVPMVFFDFMKSNLTVRAQEVVAESLRIATRDHDTHFVVTGYCDTAEAAQGCAALALRRANVVKAELVRLGQGTGAIEVHSSEELLVPTGPNVLEPQNRRVSVDSY